MSATKIFTAIYAFFSLFYVQAFSSYEAHINSGHEMHVALIAKIKPDQKAVFTAAFGKCSSAPVGEKLASSGITALQAFTREIEGSHYAVVRFAYAGSKEYLDAAKDFEAATAAIDWKASTSAHPRALTYGRHWLQTEWISFVRGKNVAEKPTTTLMITTEVIAEKEQQYRTLHQTIWPGVVDQLIRGNVRNLNIHLVELDGRLVEFLYLEYMGKDSAADDKANKADPINQRWWKLTDACQKPFSDVKEGIWAGMEPVK